MTPKPHVLPTSWWSYFPALDIALWFWSCREGQEVRSPDTEVRTPEPEVTAPDMKSARKWHHCDPVYISCAQKWNYIPFLPPVVSEAPDPNFGFLSFLLSLVSLISHPLLSGSAGLRSWSPQSCLKKPKWFIFISHEVLKVHLQISLLWHLSFLGMAEFYSHSYLKRARHRCSDPTQWAPAHKSQKIQKTHSTQIIILHFLRTSRKILYTSVDITSFLCI